MPQVHHFTVLLPIFLVVGILMPLIDRRWGMPVRRSMLNLVSPRPQVIEQGFIYGRSRSARFFWSCVVAGAFSALLCAMGLANPFFEMPFALLEAVVCLVGMLLAPAAEAILKAIGLGLDTLEKIEVKVKADGPQLVGMATQAGRDALASGQQGLSQLVERITAPGDPVPTQEEKRQSKIDKMDELLGKKAPGTTPEDPDGQ